MATGPEADVLESGREGQAVSGLGEKMAAGTVALERLRWRLEELEQRLGGGACEPRKVLGPALSPPVLFLLPPPPSRTPQPPCPPLAAGNGPAPSLCAPAGGGRAGEGAGGAEQHRRQEGARQDPVQEK